MVGLLREPKSWDAAALARLAGRAWRADLGDGDNEGRDGYVAGTPPLYAIGCGQRLVVVHCVSAPYVPDVDVFAERITDLRIRSLFREHKAWFSCDAFGVNRASSPEEVRQWYGWLGRLVAELLDENCLLLFLPDTHELFPVNEETEAALRSSDPRQALMETATLPLIGVDSEDPLMQKAVAKARARWPEFLAAYERNAGKDFAVKAPVTVGGSTEFIWIAVTAIEGDRVYGILDNDPVNLGRLQRGSKVAVRVSDLNDWMYLSPRGQVEGGFTLNAVFKAARRRPGN
jgi:uncharacterized protein YegJ (DUF2314 family)